MQQLHVRLMVHLVPVGDEYREGGVFYMLENIVHEFLSLKKKINKN